MQRRRRLQIFGVAAPPLVLLLLPSLLSLPATARAVPSDCANRTEEVLLDSSEADTGSFARVVSNRTCGSDAHEAQLTGRVSPAERLLFAALGGGRTAASRFGAHSTDGRYGPFSTAFAVARRRGGTVSVDETHENDTLAAYRASVLVVDSCGVVLRDGVAVRNSWLSPQQQPQLPQAGWTGGGACIVIRRLYERVQYSTLTAYTTIADSRLHGDGSSNASIAVLGRIADGRGLLAAAATHVQGSTLGSLLIADQLHAVADSNATYAATVAGNYARLLRRELSVVRVVGDAASIAAATNLSDNSLLIGVRLLVTVTECGRGASVRTDDSLARNYSPDVRARWRYTQNSAAALAGSLRSAGGDAPRRVAFDVEFSSNSDTNLSLSIECEPTEAAAGEEALRMRVNDNRNSMVVLRTATRFGGAAATAAASNDQFSVTRNRGTNVMVDYYFCPGDSDGAYKERRVLLIARDNIESTVRLSVCWCRRRTAGSRRLHVVVDLDGAADDGSGGRGNVTEYPVAPTNTSVVRVSMLRPPSQSAAVAADSGRASTSVRVTRADGDCLLIELQSGSERRGATAAQPTPSGAPWLDGAAADNATDNDGLRPWLACCNCGSGVQAASTTEQNGTDVQVIDLIKGFGSGDNDIIGGGWPWGDAGAAPGRPRVPGTPSLGEVNAYLLYGLVTAAVVAVTASIVAIVACMMYIRRAKRLHRPDAAPGGGETPPLPPRTAWLSALGSRVGTSTGGPGGRSRAAAVECPSDSSALGLCRDSDGERDEPQLPQPYFVGSGASNLSSFSAPPPEAPPPPPPFRIQLQPRKQPSPNQQAAAVARQYSASGYMYAGGAAPCDRHSYVEIR